MVAQEGFPASWTINIIQWSSNMMKDPPHGTVKTSPRLNERPKYKPHRGGKKNNRNPAHRDGGGAQRRWKDKKKTKKETPGTNTPPRERPSSWNYRTIMLGTIFSKIFGFLLEKIISRCAKLTRLGQEDKHVLRKGRSTLDHILTLRILIKQEIFARRCLYSCFVNFKKGFWHNFA